MVMHAGVFSEGGYTDRAWIGMTALSIACHILFFSGVVFLPELRLKPSDVPSAVEVDLVSLPPSELPTQPPSTQGPAPVQVKSEPAPAEAVTSKKEPKGVEAAPPEDAVPRAPGPLQVKKSLKKRSYNASKVITKAIEKIAEQAPQSRPRSVVEAIGQLEKEVKEGTRALTTDGATATTAGMSQKTQELLDIYNAEIWDRIRKNWAFSTEMAQGRTDLEAVVNVKIMRDGEIRDIWFDNKSGNTYFDDSVLKALKKSDPLPPLPEGFVGPYYEVVFRFNLSEL